MHYLNSNNYIKFFGFRYFYIETKTKKKVWIKMGLSKAKIGKSSLKALLVKLNYLVKSQKRMSSSL